MAGNNRDVTLTIKAKDDTAAAFATAVSSLQGLVVESAKVGDSVDLAQKQVAGFANVLTALQATSEKAAKGSLQVETSIEKMGAALGESERKSADQISRMGELSVALANVNRQMEVQKTLQENGYKGDQTDYAAQAKTISSYFDTVARANAKTQAEIKETKDAIAQQQSAWETFAQIQNNVTSVTEKAQSELNNAKSVLEQNTIASKDLAEAKKNEAAAAQASAKAIADEEAALSKFKATLDPVGESISKLNAQQEQLDKWFNLGKISESEYQEGSDRLSASIERLRTQQQGLGDVEAREIEIKEKMQAAGQRWKDAIDATLPILRAEAQALKEIQELEKAGILTENEAALARKKLADETTRLVKNTQNKEVFTIFGLRGYETNNLLYQINDVISGFAMGQKPTQIFAQQFGQIFQLFQTKLAPVFSKIKTFFTSPIRVTTFAGVAAAVAAVYLEVSRVNSVLNETKRALTTAAVNVDTSGFGIKNTAEMEEGFRRIGLSADDAMASVTNLTNHGFNREAMEQVRVTALNLSIAFGVDIKNAVDEVSKAFSGNAKALEDLDEKYNFLSPEQAKHIRDLIDEGKAQEAATEALGIFSGKMSDAADKMEGPWSAGFRALKGNILSFMDSFADLTGLDKFIGKLGDMARASAQFYRAVNGESSSDEIRKQIGLVQDKMSKDPLAQFALNEGIKTEYQRQIDELNKGLKEAEDRENKAKANETEANRKKTDATRESLVRNQRAYTSLDEAHRLGMSRSQFVAKDEEKTRVDFYRSLPAGVDSQDPQIQSVLNQKLAETRIRNEKAWDSEAERGAKKREAEAKRRQALIDEQIKRQKDLNIEIDSEIEKSNHNADIREKTNDLTGVSLIQTKQEIELEDKRIALQKRLDLMNTNRKPGQKEYTISPAVWSAWEASQRRDRQTADEPEIRRAVISDVDKPVKSLEQQRERLTQLIQAYSALGQNGVVGDYEKQLLAVTNQLKDASDEADKFYAEIEAGGESSARAWGLTLEQVTSIRDGLEKNRQAGEQFGREFLSSGKAINEDFAGGISNSFISFADALGQGEKGFNALKSSFLSYANTFLSKMIEMTLKQTLFNKISGGGTGEGGAGGSFMGFISKIFGFSGGAASGASMAIPEVSLPSLPVGLQHEGGRVGTVGGMSKIVPSVVFHGAKRFHSGGLPGLTHDEVPTILKKGELVLTEAQQKAAANKQAQSKSSDILNITAFNDSDIANAMSGAHGRRVIMNMMTRNAPAFRQILNVGS